MTDAAEAVAAAAAAAAMPLQAQSGMTAAVPIGACMRCEKDGGEDDEGFGNGDGRGGDDGGGGLAATDRDNDGGAARSDRRNFQLGQIGGGLLAPDGEMTESQSVNHAYEVQSARRRRCGVSSSPWHLLPLWAWLWAAARSGAEGIAALRATYAAL
eukprot:4619634-Pleurochrysis_carterae.AAC.3